MLSSRRLEPRAPARLRPQRGLGHRASCSCAIGPDHDPRAVLDGDFRVRGVSGLRVVDASVFPRIPGTFLASAVCMISEKASDVLIGADAPAA